MVVTVDINSMKIQLQIRSHLAVFQLDALLELEETSSLYSDLKLNNKFISSLGQLVKMVSPFQKWFAYFSV